MIHTFIVHLYVYRSFMRLSFIYTFIVHLYVYRFIRLSFIYTFIGLYVHRSCIRSSFIVHLYVYRSSFIRHHSLFASCVSQYQVCTINRCCVGPEQRRGTQLTSLRPIAHVVGVGKTHQVAFTCVTGIGSTLGVCITLAQSPLTRLFGA